jgi:Sir2 family
MTAAALSAIIEILQAMQKPGMRGKTEASTTRIPGVPCTGKSLPERRYPLASQTENRLKWRGLFFDIAYLNRAPRASDHSRSRFSTLYRPKHDSRDGRVGMRIFVLTGAGISAESGLGTFRNKDLRNKDRTGIWARFDPMQLATPEAFPRDPQQVLAFYNARRRNLMTAKPNAAHFALARLEGALAKRGGPSDAGHPKH